MANNKIYLDKFIQEELFIHTRLTEIRCLDDEEIIDAIKHKNFYNLQVYKKVLLFLENFGTILVKLFKNILLFSKQKIIVHDSKINNLGNITLVTNINE